MLPLSVEFSLQCAGLEALERTDGEGVMMSSQPDGRKLLPRTCAISPQRNSMSGKYDGRN